eukprot:8171496-Lingulodinium_polyedra.AAC.1
MNHQLAALFNPFAVTTKGAPPGRAAAPLVAQTVPTSQYQREFVYVKFPQYDCIYRSLCQYKQDVVVRRQQCPW